MAPRVFASHHHLGHLVGNLASNRFKRGAGQMGGHGGMGQACDQSLGAIIPIGRTQTRQGGHKDHPA
jgi:hypothetical protein